MIKPLLATLCLAIPTVQAAPLNVAVAANVQPAFTALAEGFKKQSGIEVKAGFGSSGKFVAQIVHGAPFHLFLSADSHYPARLHGDGYTLQPPRTYAVGKLVLWSMTLANLSSWQTLLPSPAVHHIALANPVTAPYGQQAIKVLTAVGLRQQVDEKLVYGESVAQANQFIATGAAEVGFTAKSVVIAQQGHWLAVDDQLYDPITQDAVLLKHAASHDLADAQRFYDYLFSPEARAILQRYGYTPP